MALPPVLTIGYEAATLADVIARLRGAGAELVIDVRAVASSRRAGFSKTVLAASLAEAGIGYLHLRPLGTPKPGREAARAGRCDEMRAIFAEHLQTPAAALALEQAVEVTRDRRAALLCYEASPDCCHRQVVAQRIIARTGAAVVDL